MTNPDADKVFAGSVPRLYETYLVPMIFEPYATDLVGRVISRSPMRILEIAAGTGAVTRQLAAALPAGASIVATDLNQAMIDQAASGGALRSVSWRQADAQALPFEDAAFDLVICQFGVMFFPDKPKAFAEAHRVLQPRGAFIFNVWDRPQDNEFAEIVTSALAALYPDDPPRFLTRTPYAYNDRTVIAHDLSRGGFSTSPDIATVAARGRARSARDVAMGYCQGTPLRAELEPRGASALGEATDAAEKALAQRFGAGPVDSKIQALVVTVDK